MVLSFPNESRIYDARRDLIRFWGYDDAFEVCFFLEVAALDKLASRTGASDPSSYLEVFDAARERIHRAASKIYSRRGGNVHLLTAGRF